MKNKALKISVIVLGLIISLCLGIGANGCSKRGSRGKTGSSNVNTFTINAPTNLVATVISPYQIDLNWQDNSNNDDGFEIERSTDNINYNLLATVSPQINYYAHAGLNIGTTYYYRIRALNTIGDWSDYSNIAVATTMMLAWDRIAAGDGHSIARANNGTLWACGLNDYGQLGVNDIINRIVWTKIGENTDWSLIACGSIFTLALQNDKSLWSWGSGGQGQLGMGDTYDSFIPYQIGGETDWSKIDAGFAHSVALKNNGTLYAWGYNNIGQLGFGDSGVTNTRLAPTQVGTDSDWADICAAMNHTLGYKSNGSIFAWGWNSYAQLGLGDVLPRSNPAKIGTESDWIFINANYMHNIGFKTDNTLWGWGANFAGELGLGATGIRNNMQSFPVQIGTDNDWAALATGQSHTVIIKTNKTIWSCGFNTYGQLGLPDNNLDRNTLTQIGAESDWSIVRAGEYYTVALKNDRTIWAFGNNNYGQLGIINTISTTTPSLIGTDSDWSSIGCGLEFTLGLRTNKTVWAWGNNNYGQLGLGHTISATTPSSIGTCSDWSLISCGSLFALALRTNNTIWSWGYNYACQLGLGDTISRTAPSLIGIDSDWSRVEAGSEHSIGLKTNQTLYAWGSNYSGQPGLGYSDMISGHSTPTQVGIDSDWIKVYAGNNYTIGRKNNNSVWAWGLNNTGQLGLDDVIARYTPTKVGTDSSWFTLNADYSHTVAIKTNGTCWGWGWNSSGALGLGANGEGICIPTQIGTDNDWSNSSTGSSYTVIIKTNGTIWSSGDNYCGQLGLGDTNNRTTVTRIGNNSDWINVAAGQDHAMALKNNSTLWVWGRNNYGQLGLGDIIDRAIPTKSGIAPPETPTALSAAIISSNQIDLSWIDNSNSENGFRIERKVGAAGTFQEIAVVTLNTASYSDFIPEGITPGNYYYYRVGAYIGTLDSGFSNVSFDALSGNWHSATAGSVHAVAFKANGTIWSWGSNMYGQLGWQSAFGGIPSKIGTDTYWLSPGDTGLVNPGFIAAGGNHTLVINNKGFIWSWGSSQYGQLGVGLIGDQFTCLDTPCQVGFDLDWIVVAAGDSHSLAIKSNPAGGGPPAGEAGTLWAWGNNEYGQLGDLNIVNNAIPNPIGTDSDWKTGAAGTSHTIALKTNGTLWGWGLNNLGQLGVEDTDDRYEPAQSGSSSDWSIITAGSNHSLGIKSNKTIWLWGYNRYGQLGLGNTVLRTTPTQLGSDSDWVIAATGFSHTVALKSNGTIWSWGRNNYCQLGLGDSGIDRKTPTQIGIDSDWSRIFTGWNNAFAIKSNRTLWAWGRNSSGGIGLLGLGDTVYRRTPTMIGE
jgi:alpha-tubulin suppressor-like RCC1 family protein